jgi:hypothetical protein
MVSGAEGHRLYVAGELTLASTGAVLARGEAVSGRLPSGLSAKDPGVRT